MTAPVLSAAAVAAIEDLELSARLVVEGLRTGGNRSPFHGYSTEFRQHRPYRAGDDLKHLDWKLFARSDRLYTRQFRETTNVPVMLVLDTSASMDFAAAAPTDAPTKLRYAAVLAAAIAYVASDQGNDVGLLAGDRAVAARGGRLHLRALLATLDGVRGAGVWHAGVALERAARLLRRRGIVIVLSDFYDDEPGTNRAFRRLARHGHDVSLLQVLAADERALPGGGAVEFVDAESGDRRLVDAGEARVAHDEEMRAFVLRRRDEARRTGLDHALVITDEAPARALRDWLLRRGAQQVAGHAHRPIVR